MSIKNELSAQLEAANSQIGAMNHLLRRSRPVIERAFCIAAETTNDEGDIGYLLCCIDDALAGSLPECNLQQQVLVRNDWLVSLARTAKGMPLDCDISAAPEYVKTAIERIQALVDMLAQETKQPDTAARSETETWEWRASKEATKAHDLEQQRDQLLAALTEMTAIVRKHTYPQPDKPNSTWGRMEAAEAVIAQVKGGAA